MSESIIDKVSIEELQKAVNNAYNLTNALELIGYKKPRANNFRTFKQRCEAFNIDYSQLEEATSNPKAHNRYTNEEVFCFDSPVSQSTLRKRFLQLNHVEYKCSLCGIKD